MIKISIPIDELTLMNDFLFSIVMRQEQFCKPLLECILNIAIRKIVYINEQESLEAGTPSSKSVRLDVYVEDDNNTVYDLEVQTTNKRNLGKRTRYYQSMMDIRSLEKGQDYKKLKRSYIIFICDFDPYGLSRYIYTFRNRCDEANKIILEDEAAKIFINIKGNVGDINSELRAIIEYMETGEATTKYTKALEAEVETVKTDEKVRLQYMILAEEFAIERNMGRYMTFVSQIRKNKEKLTNEQMTEYFDVPDNDCKAVIRCIEAHPDWDDEKIAEEIEWEA